MNLLFETTDQPFLVITGVHFFLTELKRFQHTVLWCRRKLTLNMVELRVAQPIAMNDYRESGMSGGCCGEKVSSSDVMNERAESLRLNGKTIDNNVCIFFF